MKTLLFLVLLGMSLLSLISIEQAYATSQTTPITNMKFDFVPSDGTTLTGVVVSQSDYLVLQYKKDPSSIMLDAVPTTDPINNSLEQLLSYQNNHVSQDLVSVPLTTNSVSPSTNNIQFDFTAPAGSLLSGVILTQSDYQQLVITKDPRTILSNVSITNSTINNDLTSLIQYQNLHITSRAVNPQIVNSNSSQSQPNLQLKPHDQMIADKVKEMLSSTTINFDSKDDVNILIYKGKAFENFADAYAFYPGELVQSYYYFDRALQLDPHNKEAQTEKDKVYNKIYDLVSTLQQDEDKLQTNPSDLGALSSKRDILLQLQKYDEYMVICNKASQMYMKISNAPQLPCELNVDIALHKYDDILKLTENMQVDVAGGLSMIPLYNLGKYDALLTYLDTEISIGSNSQDGNDPHELLLIKALTLEKMGKTDQADAMYSAMGPILGQSSLDVVKGMTYFILQDYDKTVYYLEKSHDNSISTGYTKVIAYDEIAKRSVSNKTQNTTIQSSQTTSTSVFTPTQQDIQNINQAKVSQTIAAEVNIGANPSTTTIDNNVSVQTTSNTPDSLNVNVSASSQTGPKVIVFNLNATTINVSNLKDLGVVYDGKSISPAPNMDAILHAKPTDNPSFAIIVTQSGVQVLVLVPHFSTHTITITNMSKIIPVVPEFPFAVIALMISVLSIVLIPKIRY